MDTRSKRVTYVNKMPDDQNRVRNPRPEGEGRRWFVLRGEGLRCDKTEAYPAPHPPPFSLREKGAGITEALRFLAC
jgi:hypothetical protein